MERLFPRLFLCLILGSGIVLSSPVQAQEKKNLYVKPGAGAEKSETKKKAAKPAPGAAAKMQAQQPSAPAAQSRCTEREIEAFLKAEEMLLGPFRDMKQDRGLSPREMEKIDGDVDKVYARMEALTKQPEFMKKYSDLSIRCHNQIQALKK